MSKPGQISEFCKQASQVGLRVNIFGREDLATRAEIDQVPASLEGAVFWGIHVSDDFFAAYVTQHKDDSHIAHAAYSYELARLLPLLLKEFDSKPATNQAIISGLTKMRIAEGALGRIERKTGPHGELSFRLSIVIRTIVQGRVTDLR